MNLVGGVFGVTVQVSSSQIRFNFHDVLERCILVTGSVNLSHRCRNRVRSVKTKDRSFLKCCQSESEFLPRVSLDLVVSSQLMWNKSASA